MLSWSLTAAETEGLWGTPGSHPTPWECLCSPLGTSRSWGRAQQGYSSCYCHWLGGGPCSPGDPSLGPSLGQSCKAQRSHPNWGVPGAVPGQGSRQLLGYLGHWEGCRHGCPQPRQERCPSRGRAQQGAELTTLAPTGLFIFCS